MNKQKEMQLKQKLMLLTQQKHFEAARDIAVKLSKKCPKDPEVWWALAQIQIQLKEHEQAVGSLLNIRQKAFPFIAKAHDIALNICVDYELWGQGLVAAETLIQVSEVSAAVYFRQGLCWFSLRRFFSARESFQRSLALDDQNVECLNKLGLVCSYLGDSAQGLEYFRKSLSLNPTDIIANINLPWCLNYIDNYSDASILEAHQACAKFLKAKYSHELDDNLVLAREQGTKLKIGFCSQDFYRHSVTYFFLPIIKNYDRDKWHITCYSDVIKSDEVTDEVRRLADRWCDVRKLSDTELAQRVRSDEIDILIDMSGLSGYVRLGTFVQRAAPVQITYLGYPNTTGLAEMDYRLTDESSDPESMTEKYHTESLLRIPDGFLCFEPDEITPDIESLPESDSPILFGSFNAFHKITERNIRLWAQILLKVSNSRLLIKARPLNEDSVQRELLEKFNRHGIAPERLELVTHTESRLEHLGMYSKIAIHLDTFPYNGTTTTCESLWQGVPTVTLAGQNHRSRVSLSILSMVGLNDWVAEDDESYISIAVSKAQDIESLNSLRASMRDRMKASPLLDAKGYINKLENTFSRLL